MCLSWGDSSKKLGPEIVDLEKHAVSVCKESEAVKLLSRNWIGINGCN